MGSSSDEVKKPRKMARRACMVFCGPCCFYFLLLGFSPTMFKMYIEMFLSVENILPLDAPLDITDMEEVYGVHSYEETLPYTKFNMDRPLIFRNFSDCATTFETEIVPKRAKQIDEYRKVAYLPEHRPGNVYVRGVLNDEPVMRSLEDTLNSQSPDEYASFLRMFDQTDYKILMNTTWAHAKYFGMDTSFISHFSWPVVSSPIHAAPMIYTYSLQCYGIKSWLFWSHITLNKHAHYTVVHPGGGLITGSPHSIVRIPTIRANVGPGDLLFFPPMWYHAVATSAGKNVMFAMRRAEWRTFLTSFLISPRDTIFWNMRTFYHQPYNLATRFLNFVLLGMKRKRNEEMDTGKNIGFTPAKVNRFQEQFVSIRGERMPDEFRNYNGFHDFQMPSEGFKKPGTTPAKVLQNDDEMYALVYKEYMFEWARSRIQNKTLRESL